MRRAGWDEKSDAWRTFHFEFGNELEILLKDVAKFMEDHTGEVVAIERVEDRGGISRPKSRSSEWPAP